MKLSTKIEVALQRKEELTAEEITKLRTISAALRVAAGFVFAAQDNPVYELQPKEAEAVVEPLIAVAAGLEFASRNILGLADPEKVTDTMLDLFRLGIEGELQIHQYRNFFDNLGRKIAEGDKNEPDSNAQSVPEEGEVPVFFKG